MPNWVMNTITVEGKEERVKELFDFMKAEDTDFDFNKIVPLPESLKVEAGSKEYSSLSAILSALNPVTVDFGVEKLSGEEFVDIVRKVKDAIKYNGLEIDKEDIPVDEIELGKSYLNNILTYGASTWYDWCKEHWGCKWNASEVDFINDNTVAFRTPWREPMPIFDALAKKFSDLKIICKYSEEQLGFYVGETIFEDGDIVDYIEYENQSKEAYELAAELWDVDLEADGYVFDEEAGTYIYKDED